MKTLFEPAAYQEILRRLDSIHTGSTRQWGKMTVSQMLEHTARTLEMASGKVPRTQRPIGKVLSWAFRKNFVGPKPFPRNAPTGPFAIVTHEPELQPARERLKGLLADLHAMGETGCDGNVHSFFGKLSGREWGITQYKHLDHHLRQFGA
jgi:Protein of unknown function (DUF1569)